MVARIFGRHPTLSVEGHLPTFEGATGWLNSSPLEPEGLRSKVVAVDFCTYTCINWLRTLPYVRAWAEKYRDHGLVTIGVHTPEFSFEHDVENVRRTTTGPRSTSWMPTVVSGTTRWGRATTTDQRW